jgi:DNA phosphorothioation system restriction enzyme
MYFFNQLDNSLDLPIINWEEIAENFSRRKTYLKVSENKILYQAKSQNHPQIPDNIQLRDYQKTAVISWFKNKGRGTLKMATGSGKTIIGLAIATELYQQIGLQVLLVVCPFRHLVIQWERECKNFSLQSILAFENVNNWHNNLSTQLYNIRSNKQKFLTVITTNSTLISDSFQSQLKFFPAKTLIIGDEAHNLGSPRLEASLPRNIGLRLGLSATPERYFDEEGTDNLLQYFGNILQPEFTLADAINKGALVHYLYYPILVNLTPGESYHYAQLTQRIGWALNKSNKMENNDNLTSLLMKRARLLGAAQNKLEVLKDLMKTRLNTSHTLFYCGDGHVTGENTAYQRQVTEVTRILGKELGYRVNIYTAETNLNERETMRVQFENGELQGLVAIRCLDEGVDIPAIKNAVILASTGNPRQFIQRRGRILRPHPDKNRATLFDMIVMPPELDRGTWQVEKNLLKRELKRFVEFADLADNAAEARLKLLNFQEKYSLLDI